MLNKTIRRLLKKEKYRPQKFIDKIYILILKTIFLKKSTIGDLKKLKKQEIATTKKHF
jgi:hypothetical protein